MKTMLVDDKYATVGTINLDLRSFHLNYENAIFLNGSNAIEEIKFDFQEMLKKCKKAKDPKKIKVTFFKKLYWALLKCFAPMF